jgi:hypothetical protein
MQAQKAGMSHWRWNNFSIKHNPIVKATETKTKTNIEMFLGTYYKTSKRDISRLPLFSCKFMF